MPITKEGWELHVVRTKEQKSPTSGRVRTVGTYQVFHKGVAQTGPGLSGTMAESRGPGANKHPAGKGKRIEAKRYPLSTHGSSAHKYATFGFKKALGSPPCVGFLVLETDQRVAILVHPGKNSFLSSIGCLNPCKSLPKPTETIDYVGSRDRVIAMIEDMKAFLGSSFPTTNGKKIPNAHIVIDGEP